MDRLVSELFDTLEGRSVAVIGGGVSSLDDLAQLPSNVVTIAVNHHCNGVLEPDYVVGLDAAAYGLINYAHAKTIGPFAGCDYITHDQGKQLLTMGGCKSAHKAAEMGIRMGAENVYLCGVDCYTGDKPYLNDDRTWGQWASNERLKKSLRPMDQKICADRWANAFGKHEQVKPVTKFLKDHWHGV